MRTGDDNLPCLPVQSISRPPAGQDSRNAVDYWSTPSAPAACSIGARAARHWSTGAVGL